MRLVCLPLSPAKLQFEKPGNVATVVGWGFNSQVVSLNKYFLSKYFTSLSIAKCPLSNKKWGFQVSKSINLWRWILEAIMPHLHSIKCPSTTTIVVTFSKSNHCRTSSLNRIEITSEFPPTNRGRRRWTSSLLSNASRSGGTTSAL